MYFLIRFLVYIYYGKFALIFSWFRGLIYFNSGVVSLIGWVFYFFFLVVFLRCFFGFFRYSEVVFSIFIFTFFFSLCSWLVTFFYFISYINFFVYLRKEGDVFYLTFFLMLIEIVREFSRPLSLRIRLFVNIRVGHALCVVGYVFYEFVFGLFIYSLILILIESVVFLIQRYIFSRLLYIYMGDSGDLRYDKWVCGIHNPEVFLRMFFFLALIFVFLRIIANYLFWWRCFLLLTILFVCLSKIGDLGVLGLRLFFCFRRCWVYFFCLILGRSFKVLLLYLN